MLATSTAAISIAHGEFSRMKSARGASQIASSDVPKMRRRRAGRLALGWMRQALHTAKALAKNTASARSPAELTNPVQDIECTRGNRHTTVATAPPASNPVSWGNHLVVGRRSDAPKRSRVFMLDAL